MQHRLFLLVAGPACLAAMAVGACSTGSLPSAHPAVSQTGGASSATTTPEPTPTTSTTVVTATASTEPSAVRTGACVRTVLVGYSVRHRAITACERGTPGGVALVVVGVIHGNEQLGLSVVSRLRGLAVPPGVDLWLVASVNPDGMAADTRQNAHHVDLNRNWPPTWQPSSPALPTYGGARPLSEPESRALESLLLRLRPRTVVVFHSPLDAVDFSEGADPAVTRYLAHASGYPARTLGARPGSFTGWFNSRPWGGTAITFEFASSASSAQLDRVSHAMLSLAAWRAR